MSDHARLISLDREAREKAQSEFHRPLLIEAGAGTGKTSTLVARILAWSLGPGWQVGLADARELGHEADPSPESVAACVLEGITAITFTEAAAAEMAERVAEGLAGVADGKEDEINGFQPDLVTGTSGSERRLRARSLLGVLDRLVTRTIHAFCKTLLARYPLEGGLHPDLKVDADGRLLEEMIREVVEEATKEAYAETDAPLVELALRRIGPNRVAAALTRVTEDGLRVTELERDPFSAEVVADMASSLRQPIDTALQALGDVFVGSRSKISQSVVVGLETTAGLLASLPRAPGTAAIELCSGLSSIWTKKPLDRLTDWARGKFNKTESTALGASLEIVAATSLQLAPRLRAWSATDPELVRQARLALAPMAEAVREKMICQGVVGFNDLLREAGDLLVRNAGAAARERRRIRQLLVDEFQDTDRTQCDLVRVLGLSGDSDERPGLFVVGDPKQSIYGWRDADLEAYSEFQRDLLSNGGERLILYRNFRSVPTILDEVERAVAPVMHEVENLQPAFAELIPSAENADKAGFDQGVWSPVEYWISWADLDPETGKGGPETAADMAAAIEAGAIARDIARLHHEAGVEYSSFGLLLRATTRVETYLAAMREAGVPFKVAKDKSYYRRREIIDAAALVRAVLNPADHLALVTFLRSPMVGLPDAAFLPLWNLHLPDLATRLTGSDEALLTRARELVREAAAATPDEIPGIERLARWPSHLEAALAGLSSLRRSFRFDDPDVFVEKLRRLILQEATEAARFLGAYRLANLERFFADLETAMEARGGDVEAILRALRRSVRESEDADEASPGGATGNAVNVMSIHGAKGLQFDHVYLPQLHTESQPRDRTSDKIDTRSDRHAMPQYRLFGAATPGFYLFEEQAKRIEMAERVRTLYVALTRAKERLVLIGNWPAAPAPVAWDAAKSHLGLLQSRRPVPEDLAVLVQEIGETEGGRDTCHARFKLASAVAGEGRGSSAASKEGTDETMDPAEIGRDLANASALRAQAGLRMKRDWSRAASAESADRLEEIFSRAEGDQEAESIQEPMSKEPMSKEPMSQEPMSKEPLSRAAAQVVGEAFHRIMETWDLAAEPQQELTRLRAEALDAIDRSPDRDASAGARARELIDRFSAGSLIGRFLEIAPRIMGREIPVLLPPADDIDEGVVGFTSGVVDLLYRDAETGAPVIVDFKTDRLASAADLTERAAAYHPQERLYARAIQGALDLAEPPRTELWFIWPDALSLEGALWKNGGHHETTEIDD